MEKANNVLQAITLQCRIILCSTSANIFLSNDELIQESPWDSKICLKHKYFHDWGPKYKYHLSYLVKNSFAVERIHAKILCIILVLGGALGLRLALCIQMKFIQWGTWEREAEMLADVC